MEKRRERLNRPCNVLPQPLQIDGNTELCQSLDGRLSFLQFCLFLCLCLDEEVRPSALRNGLCQPLHLKAKPALFLLRLCELLLPFLRGKALL